MWLGGIQCHLLCYQVVRSWSPMWRLPLQDGTGTGAMFVVGTVKRGASASDLLKSQSPLAWPHLVPKLAFTLGSMARSKSDVKTRHRRYS